MSSIYDNIQYIDSASINVLVATGSLSGTSSFSLKGITSSYMSGSIISSSNVFISNGMTATGQYFCNQFNIAATSSHTNSLNWNNGNVQYIQLLTGSQIINFSNPNGGGRYLLLVKQPASGNSGSISWSTSISWSAGTSPVLTTTNNKVDIMTFIYDSLNSIYYGNNSVNY